MDVKQWVIIDTDIGGDIDDTWALGLMLKINKFDIKLITITGYDTYYQVQLVAKILTLANRIDIPIAYNMPQDCNRGPQDKWVNHFSLEEYKGIVYTSTLKPMKDLVIKSDNQIRLLSIGCKTNIAELLRNCDEALDKCVLYSMQSSFNESYPETNVRMDIQAARQVLAFDIEKHIIPTDVCGHTYLNDDLYKKLLSSRDVVTQLVIDNYKLWWEACDWNEKKQDPEVESSILYDPITVMYMLNEDNFLMEEAQLYIDPEGMSYINSRKGTMVKCVMDMTNEDQIKDEMVKLLLS